MAESAIPEPVSPRCPKCGSSRTTTSFARSCHQHKSSNFSHCYRDREHFDHSCRFCGYTWASDADHFTKQRDDFLAELVDGIAKLADKHGGCTSYETCEDFRGNLVNLLDKALKNAPASCETMENEGS